MHYLSYIDYILIEYRYFVMIDFSIIFLYHRIERKEDLSKNTLDFRYCLDTWASYPGKMFLNHFVVSSILGPKFMLCLEGCF